MTLHNKNMINSIILRNHEKREKTLQKRMVFGELWVGAWENRGQERMGSGRTGDGKWEQK